MTVALEAINCEMLVAIGSEPCLEYSWQAWPFIWGNVSKLCDDILTKEQIEGGNYNDDEKIEAWQCQLIAARLLEVPEIYISREFIEFIKYSGGFYIC